MRIEEISIDSKKYPQKLRNIKEILKIGGEWNIVNYVENKGGKCYHCAWRTEGASKGAKA